MLTAKDGELDEAEALDTGADDFLASRSPSPCSSRASERCCVGRRARPGADQRRRSPPRPGAPRAGGARRIALTAREFEVLEFLMRRAGQVVSKHEILDGVWDYDFDGDPNIVEVYIRRLRRKVDEPYGRHAIETVRGAATGWPTWRLKVPSASTTAGGGRPGPRDTPSTVAVAAVLVLTGIAIVEVQRRQLAPTC